MALKKGDLVQMFQEAASEYSEKFLNNILIPTGRGGTFAARDYIRALRLISCINKSGISPENKMQLTEEIDAKKFIHPAVWFRHECDSVNLAYRYDQLKEGDQKQLFESRNWVATEKIDGFRVWIVVCNIEGVEPGVWMFSRNYSDVDCGLCEYWGHVNQTVRIPKGTFLALDCECVFDGDPSALTADFGLEADTQLAAVTSMVQISEGQSLDIQRRYLEATGQQFFTFALIAPLYYNGVDYRQESLGAGMDVYDEVLKFGQSLGINLRSVLRCDGTSAEKESFLEAILSKGGEGVVFHNREGRYGHSENRDKTSWVKLKRSVRQTLNKEGLGDSIDAFITGFKMSTEGTSRDGLIGALECSIYMLEVDGTTRQHVISYCPGLSLDLAKKATVIGLDGKPTLNPVFYGRVVELDGQDISAKSLRLSHPRLIRFRTDKSNNECVYTRQFIESQVF